MKRGLLAVLLFVTIALSLIPSTAYAVPLFITIKGTVTKKGQPVPGIPVGVSCRSKSSYQFIGYTKTDSGGHYAQYAATYDCPGDAKIDVTAGPDSDGKSVSVVKSRVYPETIINVEMGTTFPIPEYSWLGGTLAAAIGVGVVAMVRRQFN